MGRLALSDHVSDRVVTDVTDERFEYICEGFFFKEKVFSAISTSSLFRSLSTQIFRGVRG